MRVTALARINTSYYPVSYKQQSSLRLGDFIVQILFTDPVHLRRVGEDRATSEGDRNPEALLAHSSNVDTDCFTLRVIYAGGTGAARIADDLGTAGTPRLAWTSPPPWSPLPLIAVGTGLVCAHPVILRELEKRYQCLTHPQRHVQDRKQLHTVLPSTVSTSQFSRGGWRQTPHRSPSHHSIRALKISCAARPTAHRAWGDSEMSAEGAEVSSKGYRQLTSDEFWKSTSWARPLQRRQSVPRPQIRVQAKETFGPAND